MSLPSNAPSGMGPPNTEVKANVFTPAISDNKLTAPPKNPSAGFVIL